MKKRRNLVLSKRVGDLRQNSILVVPNKEGNVRCLIVEKNTQEELDDSIKEAINEYYLIKKKCMKQD